MIILYVPLFDKYQAFMQLLDREREHHDRLFWWEVNPYYWRKFWERLDDQVALKETVDEISKLFNEYNEAYLYIKCVASAQ